MNKLYIDLMEQILEVKVNKQKIKVKTYIKTEVQYVLDRFYFLTVYIHRVAYDLKNEERYSDRQYYSICIKYLFPSYDVSYSREDVSNFYFKARQVLDEVCEKVGVFEVAQE